MRKKIGFVTAFLLTLAALAVPRVTQADTASCLSACWAAERTCLSQCAAGDYDCVDRCDSQHTSCEANVCHVYR